MMNGYNRIHLNFDKIEAFDFFMIMKEIQNFQKFHLNEKIIIIYFNRNIFLFAPHIILFHFYL